MKYYFSFRDDIGKNSIIIIAGLLLIRLNLNIGDYCTGMIEDYAGFVLYLILLTTLGIALLPKPSAEQKNQLPLALTFAILITRVILPDIINRPPDKIKVLIAAPLHNTTIARDGSLILFADHTFAQIITLPHDICEQFGTYEIKASTLSLNRNESTDLCSACLHS